MERRTPIARSKPLTARKPLQVHNPLTSRSTLGQGNGLQRRPATSPPPARKKSSSGDKGSPIPRPLADYILERAGGCCDWCGRYCLNGWFSRQHRLARGTGGRRDAHTAENLVLVCGSATSIGCHLRCENTDIPAAREAGFRLKPGQNPAEVPILRHGKHLVYPTANGWVEAA